MELTTPTWFKQRQGKAEPVGPERYRLTGPNLAEAFIEIRPEPSGNWSAALRLAADGPDIAAIPAGADNRFEAWEVAFELYRRHIVV